MSAPSSQYANDENLAARQRLWYVSRSRPAFSLSSWVIGMARLNGTESVLDVGCGNGSYLELMSGIGLDRSLGMLEAARRRTSVPLVCGDAAAMPFADGAFDVVLAAHMLYHVTDRRRAAAELRRVLRQGGFCVAVTNGEANQAELRLLVEEVVGHGWSWRRPSDLRFSLENGAAQLRHAFNRVARVDCPVTVVDVTDVEVLADYLRSIADTYQEEVSGWTSWDEVIERCRSRVKGVIQKEGAFQISVSTGGFLCE